MNALIFAAGLGTRLKPLTDTMPKAMVPINGKPLVQILIEKLIAIGVDEIVINVHHFAQQIIDFVHSNNNFGVSVKFSDETDMLLETGGGLKKAAALFSNDRPILIHNVDILSNADLRALYDSAHATTMLVSSRKTQRYLLFDSSNRLVGWTNIVTQQIRSPYPILLTEVAGSDTPLYTLNGEPLHMFAFSGIQVFHQQLLPLMQQWEGKFSIIDFYLSVCDKCNVYARPDSNLRLLDVGKLDTIARAEEFLTE